MSRECLSLAAPSQPGLGCLWQDDPGGWGGQFEALWVRLLIAWTRSSPRLATLTSAVIPVPEAAAYAVSGIRRLASSVVAVAVPW
jgi:hypothetical protein